MKNSAVCPNASGAVLVLFRSFLLIPLHDLGADDLAGGIDFKRRGGNEQILHALVTGQRHLTLRNARMRSLHTKNNRQNHRIIAALFKRNS